jgi:FkbM family methyltransferase
MYNKIFIDCGGYDGCSAIKFLRANPGFRSITFEPNPDLHHYYKYLPTKLIKQAVSIYDGTVSLTIDHVDGDGSSICAEKPVIYDHSIENDKCPSINVICTNLSDFIMKNIPINTYLCLKLDVEGAEYEILRKMIDDTSIRRVKKLFCEFHWDRCGFKKEDHDNLVNELKSYVEVSEWDATDYAIHKRSIHKAFERKKLLLKLWPRYLFGRLITG